MRKKRPFLLFWLFGFFLLLILSAAFSGKMTADLAQKETEKIVASKELKLPIFMKKLQIKGKIFYINSQGR